MGAAPTDVFTGDIVSRAPVRREFSPVMICIRHVAEAPILIQIHEVFAKRWLLARSHSFSLDPRWMRTERRAR